MREAWIRDSYQPERAKMTWGREDAAMLKSADLPVADESDVIGVRGQRRALLTAVCTTPMVFPGWQIPGTTDPGLPLMVVDPVV
jgi:hypothetical protein